MLLDIEVERARSIVLDSAKILESEERSILSCLGAVLAEEVAADMDIPPFDNSAMDGYAVIASDTTGASDEDPVRLKVVADLPAGYVPTAEVRPGEAVRIMTGAPLPTGTDAVVRIEVTESAGDDVTIKRAVRAGEDVRYSGEDVRTGQIILTPGTVVRPAEVGMLATLGRKRAQVVRTPRVVVLTTGDELVEPDEPVTPGKIRNSNLYSLCAQVNACGGEAIPLGTARDTEEELQDKILRGTEADMLLTSGGVSLGDYDLVKKVLDRLGQMLFWQVRMRPGAPVAFGLIGGKPMFGLPGNPTASMVAFEQFVRPAILKMSGRTRFRRREVEAIVEDSVKNRPGVRNFVRAVAREEAGQWYVRKAGEQGSAILTTMVQANALLVIPETLNALRPGDRAIVQLMDLPEAE